MGAVSEYRLSEKIPFLAENNPIVHEMPTRVGYVCTESTALFNGSLVVSGGTTSGSAVGENPGNLAAQLFTVEGSALDSQYPGGTLKKVTPRSIMRRRIFDHPEKRFVPDVSLGIAGLTGAAGTFTLNMPFKFYWALPWLKRPFDTALDTGMFGKIAWTITNGAATKQFPGNDRTFNYNGIFWSMYHKMQAYKGSGFGPTAVLFDTDTTKNLSGANPRLEINKELISDGGLFCDLLFMAESTNQALVNTIVNKINVATGADDFFEFYSADQQAMMEDSIGDASTTSTPRTGLYYVPVADDGLLTNGKPNLSARMDQSNPGTDRLIIAKRTYSYIPASMQQNGGNVVKTGRKQLAV
jgi:hypothetical protein